ncbi:SDR family NAD(P)-dependent oxidoreductase [Actinacidiphila acididurans]|uniref:SDR family NAD(P)-dependent oxidoreductase n=1 Tax=Actinacidiphila acididurans TaxID=2784346 RepID=A0ABS2TM13_9ACTN|nr:SDR family NAD(P)-dependent oxidoreductase [Actinacidiphila acididurans]MBM9504379.1 SDR family NAD(P)-dependent oxidoreductase [Actinacidiphila acididurans]
MPSTWLVTGATSGFGRLVTERALAAGAHVIAVGRRADRLADLAAQAPQGRITTLPLDITAPDAQEVLADAVRSAGRLDVLVNNAGYGLFGSVEQTGADETRAIFDTNVLANLAVLRAALPALRASRGRILQISSLIGQFAWPSSGLYSASKGAVELLSEALAHELAPTGVKVTIIEPGMFATEFATSSHVVAPDETYAPTVGKFLTDLSALPADAFGPPEAVADAIMAVAALEEPPLRLAVGADAIEQIRASLHSRLAELERWQSFPREAVGERV